MSIIHLEKSVVTLHLREMIEDGSGNNHLALLGLGVLLIGPKLLPSLVKASRPVTKRLIKQTFPYVKAGEEVSLSQWVAEAKSRQF